MRLAANAAEDKKKRKKPAEKKKRRIAVPSAAPNVRARRKNGELLRRRPSVPSVDGSARSVKGLIRRPKPAVLCAMSAVAATIPSSPGTKMRMSIAAAARRDVQLVRPRP